MNERKAISTRGHCEKWNTCNETIIQFIAIVSKVGCKEWMASLEQGSICRRIFSVLLRDINTKLIVLKCLLFSFYFLAVGKNSFFEKILIKFETYFFTQIISIILLILKYLFFFFKSFKDTSFIVYKIIWKKFIQL